MNVARSTFVRRGYLLTALAVAVLLAASSGTAWAQTIGFRQSRGTVEEGASANTATPAPLKVTISRSGTFDGPDDDDDGDSDSPLSSVSGHVQLSVVEYDGVPGATSVPFTFAARSGDSTTSSTVALGTAFDFGTEAARSDGVATTIELTISHTADDGDWNDETLVLQLSAASTLTTHLDGIDRTLRYSTRRLTVTVTDDDPMPRLKFAPPRIQLATGNTLNMTADVGVGAGGRGSLPTGIRATLTGLETRGEDDILLSVSPPESVGSIITIAKGDEMLEPNGQGRYVLGTIGVETNAADGAVADAAGDDDGIELTITAIDVSGFRDEQITFTLMDGRTEAQKTGDGGAIDDSDPATVTVLSGEETPTVTFSTDSITIDEGGMETVHLLADGDQGDQVGSVAVSVSGEATIVLEQGGSQISGGTVEFGGSANAELTIRALSDATLEDGEEKMATVTITDAGGANIGDPRSLTVTVVGSTAVPVLPLLGQLLLALLLTAGGARLYRRRQQ